MPSTDTAHLELATELGRESCVLHTHYAPKVLGQHEPPNFEPVNEEKSRC